MKFLAAFGRSILLATPAFAGAYPVWTKARFEYVRSLIQSDPGAENYALEDCKKQTGMESVQNLSTKMHISAEKAADMFCRRFMRVYVSGELTYEKYLKLRGR